MGRSAHRRVYKRIKRMSALKSENYVLFQEEMGLLLDQWRRQAEFRARHFFYKDGQPVPAVWELLRKKASEAAELGIQDDLIELCRQALSRQMDGVKVQITATDHLAARRACELANT